MQFRTHIALGVLIALVSIILFPKFNPIITVPLIIFFSILPDVDHSKSWISKEFSLFTAPIHLFFKHRGVFHSIFIPATASVILYYYHYPNLAFGIFVGYLAHLIGDAVTVQGINFLHPISKFKIEGPIRTGSLAEFIIFILLVAINGFLIISKLKIF
jgi:inner membrane protein